MIRWVTIAHNMYRLRSTRTNNCYCMQFDIQCCTLSRTIDCTCNHNCSYINSYMDCRRLQHRAEVCRRERRLCAKMNKNIWGGQWSTDHCHFEVDLRFELIKMSRSGLLMQCAHRIYIQILWQTSIVRPHVTVDLRHISCSVGVDTLLLTSGVFLPSSSQNTLIDNRDLIGGRLSAAKYVFTSHASNVILLMFTTFYFICIILLKLIVTINEISVQTSLSSRQWFTKTQCF